MIHHGDCVEVMAGMEPASIDAVVTDPPYGLEFMGKEWDRFGRFDARDKAVKSASMNRDNAPIGTAPTYIGGSPAQQWHEAWAREAFRVAKPGAYLLAFGGTRTYHRMTCAIEDAGWIIRDCLVWAYASGFPKSKALLKPAWEPIVMARKPGSLRDLAIDACRIGTETTVTMRRGGSGAQGIYGTDDRTFDRENTGRWPANVVLTDPIFDGDTPGVVGGGPVDAGVAVRRNVGHSPGRFGFASGAQDSDMREDVGYGDSGTYSRFFLIPKAARSEREPVLPSGLEARDDNRAGSFGLDAARPHTAPDYQYRRSPRRNVHPTVKPLELMRHLVRLVTPRGGRVLDPFLGSGTTGLAAEMEGFAWVGIEREAEYVAIAEARLNGTQRGLGLDAAG